METLQTMRLFVKVVDSGSFSAAGRAAGLSPASISRHMSALEQSLGVQLINRTSRKLALTDVGQLYLRRVTDILSQLDDLTDEVSEHQTTPRGLLHVHARVAVGIHFLAPVLPSFLKRYPDVTVKLWLTEEPRDLIENKIDVAIRLGNLDEPLLAVRKICSAGPRIIFGTPAYLASRPKIEKPEDLLAHNCLTWQLDGRFEDGHATWRFRRGGEVKELRLAGNLQVNNSELLRAATLADVGLALLPDWCIGEELATGQLRRVLPDYEITPTTFDYGIYAVFQRSPHVPPKIRALIEHMVSHFRQARSTAGKDNLVSLSLAKSRAAASQPANRATPRRMA
jgi:DNA-binding transcriptional LysR family regulator